MGTWSFHNRAVSFVGAAATFRTLGNATSSQNLFSIENQAGSSVLVGVRKLMVEMDSTVTQAVFAVAMETSRPTALPADGVTLAKVAQDTELTSSSSVVLRGIADSDGDSSPTLITATAGARLWHQFGHRMHTTVGQVQTGDFNMLPAEMADLDYIILRADEALLVRVLHATAGTNATSNHYVIKCAWDEYTIPVP